MMRHPLWMAIFLLTPALAHAHALGVQAKLKDGKVCVEVYYDDDTPAIKAKVKVLKGKAEITTGITDAEGRCTFLAPEPGAYEIHADAGAGHNARTAITIPGRSASSETQRTAVSEGPTRAEFTSTPWLKIGIGLGVIGILGAAFLLASMMRKNGDVVDAKDH